MTIESSGSLSAPEPAEKRSIEDSSRGILLVAADPGISEDLALALLKRPDLAPEVIEQLSKSSALKKSRKVKLAVVSHPKTPRHVSLPMIRHLFTFDLMQVALTPVVPADLKLAADEALVSRLETISIGEKLSLARRASGRVAAALLLDPEAGVRKAALDNSRLNENSIVKAIMSPGAPTGLIDAVCRHPKWCLRHEVKVALLRNEKTPAALALELARGFPPAQLHALLEVSRLPAGTKSCLRQALQKQTGKSE
jgi:hypothetical protein